MVEREDERANRCVGANGVAVVERGQCVFQPAGLAREDESVVEIHCCLRERLYQLDDIIITTIAAVSALADGVRRIDHELPVPGSNARLEQL